MVSILRLLFPREIWWVKTHAFEVHVHARIEVDVICHSSLLNYLEESFVVASHGLYTAERNRWSACALFDICSLDLSHGPVYEEITKRKRITGSVKKSSVNVFDLVCSVDCILTSVWIRLRTSSTIGISVIDIVKIDHRLNNFEFVLTAWLDLHRRMSFVT